MDYIIYSITVILICLFLAFSPKGDYIYPRLFILNSFALLLLSIQIFSISHFGLALLFSYATMSSNYVNGWQTIKHKITCFPTRNKQFLYSVSNELIDLTLLGVIFVLIPVSTTAKIVTVIPLISILAGIASFITIKVVALDGKPSLVTGFGVNTSVNSTLMSILSIASLASTLPFYLPIIGAIIGAAGAIKTKGSVGIASMLMGLTIYFAYSSFWIVISIITLLIVLFFITYKYTDKLFKRQRPALWKFWPKHNLFGLSDRDYYYKYAIDHIRPLGNKWFGLGSGGLAYAFPAIQILKKCPKREKHKQVMSWLHSDVLQWFIEGGIIGFAIFLYCVGELIYFQHGNAFAMAILGCIMVNALGNFPKRLAPDTFFITIILKYIWM